MPQSKELNPKVSRGQLSKSGSLLGYLKGIYKGFLQVYHLGFGVLYIGVPYYMGDLKTESLFLENYPCT